RRFLQAGAVGVGLAALSGVRAVKATTGDPSADLYPAMRNPRYRVDRAVTPEELTGTFNNFYEFGSHKRIAKAAQKLPIRPWQVVINGMVEQEMTLDIDDLMRRMPLEERVYRLRCVEAWSATIP